MGTCSFSFDAVDGGTNLLKKARTSIKEIGGELTGNDEAGSFKLPTPLGTVKGNYFTSTRQIHLEITDKPMLIGCSKIEEKLKEYLMH